MKPRWLFYKDGHDLDLDMEETVKRGEQIFQYTAKEQATAYVDSKGRILTPNKKNKSNLASIPFFATIIKGFERWRYAMTAVLHDNVYDKGGLWQYTGTVAEYIVKPDQSKFVFVKLTRHEGDDLLKEMMIAEADAHNYTGLKKWFWDKYTKYVTSPAYWIAVRGVGWMNWRADDAK